MTRLLASTLLFAAAVATDPIATGTWNITGDVQGYPVTESCVLTQTDATLAGTCTDSGKVVRAATGSVAEKTITIVHPSEYNGDPLTLTFKGTLDDSGTLKGTIDVYPLEYQGTFSAAKATPKP